MYITSVYRGNIHSRAHTNNESSNLHQERILSVWAHVRPSPTCPAYDFRYLIAVNSLAINIPLSVHKHPTNAYSNFPQQKPWSTTFASISTAKSGMTRTERTELQTRSPLPARVCTHMNWARPGEADYRSIGGAAPN